MPIRAPEICSGEISVDGNVPHWKIAFERRGFVT